MRLSFGALPLLSLCPGLSSRGQGSNQSGSFDATFLGEIIAYRILGSCLKGRDLGLRLDLRCYPD